MSSQEHRERCSFCGKHKTEVSKLIANDSTKFAPVSICNECIDLCSEIIHGSTAGNDDEPETLVEWTDFDFQGQRLQWSAQSTTVQSKQRMIMVAVQTPDGSSDFGRAYPEGTEPTEELAREVAAHMPAPRSH